ncbi:VOC family protein [Flindersiella endophytica]
MQIVVTLDCVDLEAQAEFWLAALAPLGYRRAFDASPYLSLTTPTSGPTLLLQRVPETKQGKNRMHLDLDLDLDIEGLAAEVERLERLGARRVSGELYEVGHRWVVLTDPEGNEFCVFVPPSRAGRPDRG